MDIACPKCAAAYEIDESTVGPKGRKVRCSACGEIWRAMPVDAPASVDAEPPWATATDSKADDTPVIIAEVEPAPPKPEPPEPASTETATAEIRPSPGEPPAATAEAEMVTPTVRRGAKLVKDKGTGRPRTAAWRKLADWRIATVAGTVLALAAGLHQREAVVRLLPQTARLYAAAGFPVNLRGIEIRNVNSRLIVDNDEPVLVVDGDLVNVADRRVDVPRLHFTLHGPDGRQVYVWSAQADRTNLQPGETLNFRRRLAAPPAEAKNVSVRFVTRSDITAGIR